MKIKFLIVCLSIVFACKNNTTNQPLNPENTSELKYSEIKNTKNSDSLELQKIIQKAIDLPELQQYYHVSELPNRSPLIIYLNNNLYYNFELFKFGKRVEIIKDIDAIKQKPHIKFNVINVTETIADLDFTYKVEGINVSMKLEKNNTNWIVINSKITEN